MNKLKCIMVENGELIPLNAISKISAPDSENPNIWTNDDYMYSLSKEQYEALLKEVEIIK